jgi:hypothetical protein
MCTVKNKACVLFPEEGKKNPGEHTDLANPKDEHPLDKISPQIGYLRSEFSHFLS